MPFGKSIQIFLVENRSVYKLIYFCLILFLIIMKNDLDKLSLLVVDDSTINQRVVAMSLRNTMGEIDSANNGMEAYRMYCEKHYDIILMDGRMPIMDGYEATQKIRDYEKEQALDNQAIIIALTGSDTDHEMRACRITLFGLIILAISRLRGNNTS